MTYIKETHILSKDEIDALYRNTKQLFQEKAFNLLTTEQKNINLKINQKVIRIFTSLLYLYFKYNLSEKIFHEALKKENQQQLKKYYNSLLKDIKSHKINEEKIIRQGLILRLINGTQFPSIFLNRQRIYIKIPTIQDTELFLENVVERMNTHLSNKEKIKLKIKNDSGKKRFFIQEGNKEIKFGKYLVSILKSITILKETIFNITQSDFQKFTTILNTKFNTLKEFQKELSLFFKSQKKKGLSIPSPILFEIKKYSTFSKENLSLYLNELEAFYSKKEKEIQEIQTATHFNNKSGEKEADMIIISAHPQDIARMSEYTLWDTCMAQNGEFAYDLPFQIGAGSLVAYLVNSKNPYQRLARIMLKPFMLEADYKKRQNMQNLLIDNQLHKEVKHIESLMNTSPLNSKTRHIYLKFFNKLKDIVQPLLNLEYPHLVYFLDKQYGLANKGFSSQLSHFTKIHLDTPNTFGLVNATCGYYKDKLRSKYYISDINNPNNLIEYLNSNNYWFRHIEECGKTYTLFNTLILPDDLCLNLSGTISNYVEMNSENISFLDERGLKTKTLSLSHVEKLSELPKNIQILNKLILKSDNLIFLPQNINVPELVVEANQLKIIPENTTTRSLIICHTNVNQLPNLTLETLIAKNTKISNISNIKVSKYLDLSSTPINNLGSNINLEYLLLRNCKEILSLPKKLKVDWLDISNTNIDSIPENEYQYIGISHNKKLTKLPLKIQFKNLDAQSSALSVLPDNISANKIDIKKTNITTLPNNLKVSTLIINQTKISSLPPSLHVHELHAINTKIKEIPSDIDIHIFKLEQTDLEIIHYSKNIERIYLHKIPPYIHPDLSEKIFLTTQKDEIIKSQQRYYQKFVLKINPLQNGNRVLSNNLKNNHQKEFN